MAKKPEKKAVAKKTSGKRNTEIKQVAKKVATKKAPSKKSQKQKSVFRNTLGKNVKGYGVGSVDVVMSVDQVAREAASIAANAPTDKELDNLVNGGVYLTINNLREICLI